VPALCVHGLGVSPRHFRPLIDVLSSDRRVVAPTLPQGVAPDELARLLDERIDERTVVFANSMGCQTAVELALRAPERIAGLVLVGPTPDPAAPTLVGQFARLAHDSVRESAGLNYVVVTDYIRRGPVRTLRSAKHMLRHPMRERANDVRVPAVVVRGERDPIVSPAWAEDLARALRAEVIAVPRAAHAAHFTHPREVAAAAARFV
jgi:pimeloyl-ACP methyl ester carboxylesterase